MHTMDKEINTRKIWLILNLLVDIKEFCARLLFGKGIGNYCSFFFEEKKGISSHCCVFCLIKNFMKLIAALRVL